MSPRRAAIRPRLRTGFSILEILVAMTIFALVTTIIFTVFRTAIRTQTAGERELEAIQRGRVVFETLERDVANLFFRDETSYNVQIGNMLESMERERLLAEETGNWDNFRALYGDPFKQRDRRRRSRDDEEQATLGDPFKRGRLIDLQFQGTDGGDSDSLHFAIHTPLTLGDIYQPWGLQRVNYRLDNGILVRVVDSVESNRTDLMGNILAKASTPDVTRLAENVKVFDVRYAFWFDNQWYEVKEWSSARRQIRNSNYLLAPYDEDRFGSRENNAAVLLPGDPGYNERLNFEESELLDRLPAYIRVRLVIADAARPERTRTLQRILRIAGSEETYTPNPNITEEERDAEREERDSRYQAIFPGVLEEGR